MLYWKQGVMRTNNLNSWLPVNLSKTEKKMKWHSLLERGDNLLNLGLVTDDGTAGLSLVKQCGDVGRADTLKVSQGHTGYQA